MKSATVPHTKNIPLNIKVKTQNYFVDTVQHIFVNDSNTENRISTRLKKEYLSNDNFGHLIKLELLSREQSNTQGMLGVEERLSLLFKKLIIYLNDSGEIKSIINLKEIKQDWYDQKSVFKKEFKDNIEKIDDFLDALDSTLESQNDFIQIIKKSDIVTLVLPPIYNEELLTKETIKQQKVFDNFFGNNDVPISIDTALIAKNEITNGYQVSRSGDIDYVLVNLNNIKRFFRKNYNNQSLPVKLDVAYLETFDLDQNHDVDIATLMLGIEIKDLYQFRQISKTQKIS